MAEHVSAYSRTTPLKTLKPIKNTFLVETTKKTEFFDITDKVESLGVLYDRVLIVDQPGVGGLEINEAGYLR